MKSNSSVMRFFDWLYQAILFSFEKYGDKNMEPRYSAFLFFSAIIMLNLFSILFIAGVSLPMRNIIDNYSIVLLIFPAISAYLSYHSYYKRTSKIISKYKYATNRSIIGNALLAFLYFMFSVLLMTISLYFTANFGSRW